jgi:hypothetical protein
LSYPGRSPARGPPNFQLFLTLRAQRPG